MWFENEAAPVRVHKRMALASVNLLSSIVTAWPAGLGGFGALAVDDCRRGAGVASDPFAICHHERRPIGSYPYDKILETGDKASCRVDVFALRVTRQRKRWPEKLERQVRWYPPAEAARFVRDPHLRRIIRKFTKSTKLR
jgi:hypothetical protein